MRTKAQQQNELSAGLAVGLLDMGRDRLPAVSKMVTEFASEHAWRRWPHRSAFHLIRLGHEPCVDTILQMTHADKNKRVPFLYWESLDGEDVIVARHQDSPLDLDLAMVAAYISETIPLDAWRVLAKDFLADLCDAE